MSDRNSWTDSWSDSDELETAIDDFEQDVERSDLPTEDPEAAGYSFEEFEEDAQSTPVSDRLSASAPHSQRNRSVSAERQRETDEAVTAHSPFIPEDSVTSSDNTAPPAFDFQGYRPSVDAPPSYSQVSTSARPGQEVRDSGQSADESADESTSFLRSQRLLPSAEDISAAGIELQEVSSPPSATDEELPSPPSYSVAVARVDAGISRQLETTFGPEITTQSSDEDTGHVVDGIDEPPPGYSAIAMRGQASRQAESPGESNADVEANAGSGQGCCHSTLMSRLQCSCVDGSTKRAIVIISVISSIAVLCVVLFPIQFSYVAYYEFGLVRTKSTGRVATDRVYEHGCYVLGADKEFVYLDRTVQPIQFNKISMFTKDNVDVSIDVQLYYHLNYEDVGQLWRDYAGDHEPVISAAALTVIRNCAPRILQDEYLLQREYVQTLLHDAVNEKFVDWGINVTHLNYLNLYLPERVLEKKLNLLLIRTDIEKEQAYQLQREIELETELLTTPVIYEAKEAINNGTYEAAAIRTIAETEKAQHVDVAHANAFNSMMDTLNVTQQDHALSFYYLATLGTMDHYGGIVEYAKRGAYMP